MFLVFTLVLLVVAIGILFGVYSVFFPFMQNLGTVQQYHQAYYGAISALERAELALRYRAPGFQGSGGYLGMTGYGPLSDYTPTLFSGAHDGFVWNITSRTSILPSSGKGNVDPMLSAPDSYDYNQLGYTSLETFLLGYDSTTDAAMYYTGGSTPAFFSGTIITGVIRFPPKMYALFGGPGSADLCDQYFGADCDPDGDGIYDDIVVSWSLEGRYQGQGFKIFPTISVFYYSGMQVDENKDNAFRESFINNGGNMEFRMYYSPILPRGAGLTKHNVVSALAGDIEHVSFSDIFSDPDYTGFRLSLGAVNLFRTFTGVIYPYLEYQFTFPQEIADRFYTIEGNGRVGEYDVHIILKKPTVQGTVGSDFTVIF